MFPQLFDSISVAITKTRGSFAVWDFHVARLRTERLRLPVHAAILRRNPAAIQILSLVASLRCRCGSSNIKYRHSWHRGCGGWLGRRHWGGGCYTECNVYCIHPIIPARQKIRFRSFGSALLPTFRLFHCSVGVLAITILIVSKALPSCLHCKVLEVAADCPLTARFNCISGLSIVLHGPC